MTPDEAMVALGPQIKRHEKPCWIPVVKKGDGSGVASKFGGIPWLDANEAWPMCKGCERPLELFLQLNLSELPAELDGRYGAGLLQLFYCSWSDGDCAGDGGWEPFSDTVSLVRIVLPEGNTSASKNLGQFPAKKIVGWERSIDHPNSQEHEQLGIEIDYHFRDVPFKPVEVTCQELGLHFTGIEYANTLEETVHSQAGDKLAGWPAWVQGIEYPDCPKCGDQMRLVFQIDSEVNIPFMFGDCGVGQLTQCETHKEVVAFGWACS